MMPVLQEYEVSTVLLRESTGVIYSGSFKKSGLAVAVEEIASDLRTTPGFITRLADAGKLAAALHHPHAVTVYNLVEEGDTLCLITEMISGRPLRALVPRGAVLPPASALAVVDDVLSAIEAAHRAGIVHGDVRPDSITVDPGGEAILGAFAIAYAVATTPGAPAWRHPAYAAGRPQGGGTDEAGDVYACAALAHELLTGAPPGEADVTVPEAMSVVLGRALGTDPLNRLLPASSFRAALADAAAAGYGEAWRTASDMADRALGTVAPPVAEVALRSAPMVHAVAAEVAGNEGPADGNDEAAEGSGSGVVAAVAGVIVPDAIPAAGAGAAEAAPPGVPTMPEEARDAAEGTGTAAASRPRLPGRRGLAIAAVVIILAVVVAVLLLTGAGGITNSGPLGVNSDVRLTVTPQQGGCNTTFHFTATGTLHGTGTLIYRFDQSDGRGSGDTSVPITTNESSFRLTRQWRLQDSLDVKETMTFRIVQPGARTATQTFSYTCF